MSWAAQGRLDVGSRGRGPRPTAGTVWVLTGSERQSPLWQHVADQGQAPTDRPGHHRRPDRPGLPGPAGADHPRGRYRRRREAIRWSARLDGPATTKTCPSLGLQNSRLMTDDLERHRSASPWPRRRADGGSGYIEHYEIPGSNGAAAGPEQAMARVYPHDPQLDRRRRDHPGRDRHMPDPGRAPGGGYNLVASDGDLLLRRGALLRLDRGAMTVERPHRGDGPWPWPPAATGWSPPTGASSPTAAPRFYGSMGGLPLNQPIVRGHTPPPTAAGLLAGGVRWRGIFASAMRSTTASMGGQPLDAPDRGHGRRPRR